jgi:hypothetical protein
MLKMMSEDLPHVCNHIADSLAISTSSAPYRPPNIRAHLNVKQQLIDSKKSSDMAMVATKEKSGHPNC